MIGQQLFFHTPFSSLTVAKGEGPALLLQFILRELLRSEDRLNENYPPQMAPFDWAWKQGSLHKVREHADCFRLPSQNLLRRLKDFLINCMRLAKSFFHF